MPHHTPLISTIVIGLVMAFTLGTIAHRFRLSPLIGYLLAGVLAGPFTPGYVADQGLANQLAEIGVILLMFGVGLHFSLKDLLSVKAIAIPGAVVQIASATLLGMGLAWAMGWNPIGGLVFGLALSVASTVVLLRSPVLSSVEDADDMPNGDEPLSDVLGPESNADEAGGKPAEERPTGQQADEPGR